MWSPAMGWAQVTEHHPELKGWLQEDIGDERARALAEMVAAYQHAHHHGPTWSQAAAQARPQLVLGYSAAVRQRYADRLIRTLATHGWLIYHEGEAGSLRPGARLEAPASRPPR
jgi:hypothetical protein